jgi:hypothetical protein
MTIKNIKQIIILGIFLYPLIRNMPEIYEKWCEILITNIPESEVGNGGGGFNKFIRILGVIPLTILYWYWNFFFKFFPSIGGFFGGFFGGLIEKITFYTKAITNLIKEGVKNYKPDLSEESGIPNEILESLRKISGTNTNSLWKDILGNWHYFVVGFQTFLNTILISIKDSDKWKETNTQTVVNESTGMLADVAQEIDKYGGGMLVKSIQKLFRKDVVTQVHTSYTSIPTQPLPLQTQSQDLFDTIGSCFTQESVYTGGLLFLIGIGCVIILPKIADYVLNKEFDSNFSDFSQSEISDNEANLPIFA